ncbi:MAG: hypothetical protein AAGG48_11610 [Planctomycetota bacterium]
MSMHRRNRRSKRQRRRLLFQSMESRRLLAGDGLDCSPIASAEGEASVDSPSAYHNSEAPTDVNDDGVTQALDALLVINHLIDHGSNQDLTGPNETGLYPDVNNDGVVSPIDVLGIINVLINDSDDSSGSDDDSDDDSGMGDDADEDVEGDEDGDVSDDEGDEDEEGSDDEDLMGDDDDTAGDDDSTGDDDDSSDDGEDSDGDEDLPDEDSDDDEMLGDDESEDDGSDSDDSDDQGDDEQGDDEQGDDEQGENGNPFIVGSELIGSDESEEVIGFESDDTLTGGDGGDVFWVTAGDDVITDFNPDQDVLKVSDFANGEDGIATLTSLGAIAALSEQITIDGETALVIDVDGDQGDSQTTLIGITIDDLTEENVYFEPDESDLPVDVTHLPMTTIQLSDGTIAEFEGHDFEVHPLPFQLVSGDQASVDFINEHLGLVDSDDDTDDDSDDDPDGGGDGSDDDDPDMDGGDGDADEDDDSDGGNGDDDDPSDDDSDSDGGNGDSDTDGDTDDGGNDGDSDTDGGDGDTDTDGGDGDSDTDGGDGDSDTDGGNGDDDSDDGTDTGNDDTTGLNLQIDDSLIGTTEGFEIRTNGIFAVWWDPQAGPLEPGPEVVFELLDEVRNDVRDNLGLGDPPNTAAGFYFNVFVHRGEDDRFPNFLGNGVGFEANTDLPDLALPVGLHDDRSNVLHEGFHVFQTSSSYEVVDTNPDAPWIVEASAEWYQAHRNPTDERSFVVAGSPYALPHLSWWYTPGREPEGVTDDNGWLYGVREYAMSSFLYYLTNIESVDPAVIAGVYATDSTLTAQEYIFNEVGGDNLREMFADWAVRNAAGLDFLSPEQVDFALNELAAETTPDEVKNNILELDASEADGTFEPSQELTPGGWAYNSIKINNTSDTTYTIDVMGDATGSQGAAAHFEARVAVVNQGTTTYFDVPMAGTTNGRFTLDATENDSEIYIVVASTPDQLTGTQTYGYQIDISTS